MTEQQTALSPYGLSDELDRQALKYQDFSSGALAEVATGEAFEKVCTSASGQMNLYFKGVPDHCTLKVVRSKTSPDAEPMSKDNSGERDFTWDKDAGKWREVAADFKNEELADKLRDWLVSNVDL